MNWTKEQKAAIEKRGADLLVSAAAGSGKTAVLSSRIVSLLTDPVSLTDIDRILVVTFTNAAASEMRERIGKRIMEAREEHPLNQHLKKQSTLLHNAMITTIDSFCLYVLKNYGNRIGFAPGFSVADPGECNLLAEDVMEQLVTEVFEEKDPERIRFFEAYRSSRSISPVKDLIRRVAAFSESFPWPDRWLLECMEDADSPEKLFESRLVKEVSSSVRKELKGYAEELSRCISICLEPDGPGSYAETLHQDVEELLYAAGCADSWDRLSSAVGELISSSLKPLRKFEGDPLKKSLVMGTRNEIKDEINKLKSSYFSVPEEEHIRIASAASSHLRALIGMTRRFRELFSEKKREKNVVDFSDIEHLALQILVDAETMEPTEVAGLLSDRFDEIMIDEYQDSNLVQETILSSIARKEKGQHNRFMVGDVKQSIYRFRQARPELFMEKYAAYREEGEEQKITLHQNFRSRREILDAANHIFYRLMGEDVGGITYDEDQALSCGASFPPLPEGETCFSMRLMEDNEEERTVLSEAGYQNPELLLLIDTIRSLMEKKMVTDEAGGFRELRYSDIAVLVRSPGSVGEEMQKALRDAGIPALLPTRTGFFATQEIRVLLNLLRIIDNPEQDIPLVSVMRSEFGGFTESELAKIRLESAGEKIPFYRCVQRSEAGKKFLAWLSGYRELSSWMPVAELLQKILDDSGYLEKLAAKPSGEQRCANARMLVEKAVTYGKTSFHGLFRFIRYIENLEKYEEDFGEAELLNEDMDAIRILSIHKSKGLEFPVVILYGSGRKLNRRDMTDRLLLSPEHGIGLMYVDGEKRTRQSTLRRDAISELLQRDSVGEEIRVLYVGLTRAKEMLVITGVKTKLEEYAELCRLLGEGWGRTPVSSRKRLACSCYLDLLLMAALSGDDHYEPEIVTAKELTEREKTYQKTGPALPSPEEMETEPEEKPFHYPYSGEELIRDKISVSEWKRRVAEEEGILLPELNDQEEEPVPSFAKAQEAESVDFSLRGSAFHRAMECLDFTEVPRLLALEKKERIPYLRTLFQAMQESGKLTKEYFELLNLTQILAFLESPVAKRMANAEEEGTLCKEKPFVLGLAAGRVYGGSSTETVITQGIIDVFFREGEKVVILDYKTDHVKSEDELKSKYKIQLDIYEEAVRRITKCKETEKLLYSFTLRRAIVV